MGEYDAYIDLAADTGAFQDIELEILEETIKICKEQPGKPYSLVEFRDGPRLAGYGLYHKANGTDMTWDIHTLVLDPSYQRMGIGTALLDMMADEIAAIQDTAVLRAETSGRKEESVEPGVYLDSRFMLLGHIPSFYEEGNDYLMYTRFIGPKPAEKGAHKPAPEAGESGEIPA